MRFNRIVMAIFMGLALLATGCQPGGRSLAGRKPQVATPEAGKTTIAGQIVSAAGKPIPNMVVRLAEVYREGGEGAYALDGAFSPGARTDEDGYFAFENIDARDYVIVVGDVYSVYEVIAEASGKPKAWSATAGEILDAGVLKVDLPIP